MYVIRRFHRFAGMSGADREELTDALQEASLISTVVGRCLADKEATARLREDLKAQPFGDVLLLPYE